MNSDNKPILLVAINAKFIHSNPAVHMLKAASSDFSEYIDIAEYAINQLYEDILSDIYKRRPLMVAFSSYIWNINMIERIVKDLPSVLPDTDIWLGGPEVSFDALDVLNRWPMVKGVMIGEGEDTFRELASLYIDSFSLDKSSNLQNFDSKLLTISGLAFRNNDKLLFSSNRELTDISNIPFIYNDLKPFENKIIYYESSRGCPFRCSYCLSSIDKTVRLRDINLVLSELQFFLDNKVPQVKFIDRTFNCNKEHAITIWQYLLEHDNGITNFHFEVAADLICQEEIDIIEKMRPGLIQLEIGVQSTNLKTIKEIRRSMNLEKLKEVIAKIHSFNNTHQHLDLIAGLPFEDIKSFEKSFNDVYDMKPDQLQLGFLKVLKGSYMEEMVENYGLKYHSSAPYEILSTNWISYEDILLLKGIEEMVELYYNSGQFENTIRFLVKQFSSPYKMFLALSEDYKANGYDLRKPARSYRYEMLYNFVSTFDPKNVEIYKELLTLDIYLRENCKVRPSFARDLKAYYEDIKKLTSDKRNHIEIFSHLTFDMPNNNSNKPIFLEFNYEMRNPLNHNASIRILETSK